MPKERPRQLTVLSLNEDVRETGYSEVHAIITLCPNVEYEHGQRACKPIETLEAAWDALPASDLFNLQALTRAVIEELPSSKVSSLQISDCRTHSSEIRFSSDSNVRCQIILRGLSARVRTLNQGGITPVVFKILLWGTPTQQDDQLLCARQQVNDMVAKLMSRLSPSIQGTLVDGYNDLAQLAADAIYSAKHDFAEHLIVEKVRVETKMSAEDSPIMSDQDGDATTGMGEKHELSLDDFNEYDLDARGTSPVDTSTGNTDNAHHGLQTGASSTVPDGSMQATTLKDLMQELDDQLSLFSTSPLEQTTSTSMSPHNSPLDNTAPSGSRMRGGVVVALGSNVGNKIEEIEKACRAIDADPDMRIVETSFLYETKPMYVEDQERFMNGACEVSGIPRGDLQPWPL